MDQRPAGYVKLLRAWEPLLEAMPAPALRLFIVFLLRAEWRHGQRLPRGCLEMTYREMQKHGRYGRATISSALDWLERPPEGPPWIARLDRTGRPFPPLEPDQKRRSPTGTALRIQVLVYPDSDPPTPDLQSSSPPELPVADSVAPTPHVGPGSSHTRLPNPGSSSAARLPADDGVPSSSEIELPKFQIRATAGPEREEPQELRDPLLLRDTASGGVGAGSLDPQDVWEAALTILRPNMAVRDHDLACSHQAVTIQDGTLVLTHRSELAFDRLVGWNRTPINAALQEVTGGLVQAIRYVPQR